MRASGIPGTWRLLAPALLSWALVAWAVTAPGAAAWIAGLAATGACGVLVWAIRSAFSPGFAGAALILCAVLVILGVRVWAEERARADPALASAAARSGSIEFEARLAGFPRAERSPFGERWWVRGEALQPGGGVPVLLWLAEPPGSGWAPGLRIEVHGVPERFAPGDSSAYGVRVLSLRAAEQQPFEANIGALAAQLRAGLRAAAERVPGAELVPGFAVGDTSLVGSRLEQTMLDSSLTHLTAVSGANCALVTGSVLWVLSRFGAGRRLRLIVAGSGLVLFVGLVGPDASVQRAAVMAAVLLASGFGGKRSAALPALGLAVILLLVADPWQALQPGFALSVVATAGVLIAAVPLSGWLRRRARLPALLALPMGVALAAQLACGPLLLLLQPGIPAAGVLANTIAAPAAPLGTGLGLVAALVLPVSPVPGHALVVLASLPARWVAATAELTAGLPLARWHWPEGWTGALLLAVCQALILLAWALRRGHIGLPSGARVESRRPWEPRVRPPRALRAAATALACAGLGLFVAIVLVAPLTERLGTPRGWAVVACDVGQGDALLLRDPATPGEVVLVDTGDDARLLENCLDRFGVRRISLLVLSHDDRDHVGALDAVIGRVEAALISPAVSGERAEDREVVRQLERAGVPYRIGMFGERGAVGAGVRWRQLGPEPVPSPATANAASLVLLAQAGPVRVLLLGDTGLDQHAALLRQGGLEAEVLKVAHHGSRDQDPALPGAVGADWALVSVGEGNGYGHPAASVLADLARAGTRVLRTDQHGSIALVPSLDGGLDPWVERGG